MNPIMPIQLAGGVKYFSEPEVTNLKFKYIKELSCENEESKFDFSKDELTQVLKSLTLDKVQALYLTLRNKLTAKCSNTDRIEIIRSLLCTSQDQWPVILQQVCFIMPYGTRGHDVMWATKILASILIPSFREQLVNTANRLFLYDTLTVERGYILESLSKLTSEELLDLDKADEEKRASFIIKTVPEFKDRSKIVYRYDIILEEGWDIK